MWGDTVKCKEDTAKGLSQLSCTHGYSAILLIQDYVHGPWDMTEEALKAFGGLPGLRVLHLRPSPSTHRAWCLRGLTFMARQGSIPHLPLFLPLPVFLCLLPLLHLSTFPLLYCVPLIFFIMHTCVCAHSWCEQNPTRASDPLELEFQVAGSP